MSNTSKAVRPQYEDAKDDPDFAVRGLSNILRVHVPEPRLQKALYVLKTLALAAGISEGKFAELTAFNDE